MLWFLFFSVFMSSNAEASCLDIFNSNKKSSKQNTKQSLENSQPYLEGNLSSHFYSKREHFIEEALIDFRDFIKKGEKFDISKYQEFDKMIGFFDQSTEASRMISKVLVAEILKKERDEDKYYDFQEYTGFGDIFPRWNPILQKTKSLNSSSLQKIETIIPKHYQNQILQIPNYKSNRFAYLRNANKLNLIGHVLWVLKNEDAEIFLQTTHFNKSAKGAYYLTLAVLESHLYHGRSIEQVIDYLEDGSALLTSALLKEKDIHRRAYYQDKLMKTLILLVFAHKERNIKLENRLAELESNSSSNKKSLDLQKKDLIEKMKYHKEGVITSLIEYFTLAKYSQVHENTLISKYGLSVNKISFKYKNQRHGIFLNSLSSEWTKSDLKEMKTRKTDDDMALPLQLMTNLKEMKAKQMHYIPSVENLKNTIFVEKRIDEYIREKDLSVPDPNLEKRSQDTINQFIKWEQENKTPYPSRLPTKNKNLLIEVIKDYSKYINSLDKGLENEHTLKYQEFNKVLTLLNSKLGHSKPLLESLAGHILKLERSERIYKIGFFFKNKEHSASKKKKLEKRVLENYESFFDKWGKIFKSKLTPIEKEIYSNTLSLFGQIGWKARLKSSEDFLRITFDQEITMGSYYYTLTLIEKYFEKNEGDIRFISNVLSETEILLGSVLLASEEGEKHSAYYIDKLMKILILRSYINYEGFLKEHKKYYNLKDKNQKESCAGECQVYLDWSEDAIREYLLFSKISGMEDVFKEKYKLSSEGIHLPKFVSGNKD